MLDSGNSGLRAHFVHEVQRQMSVGHPVEDILEDLAAAWLHNKVDRIAHAYASKGFGAGGSCLEGFMLNRATSS